VRALWSICSSDNAHIKRRAAGAGAVEALVQLVCNSCQPTQAGPQASTAAGPSSTNTPPCGSSSSSGGSGGPAPPAPAACVVCSSRGSRQQMLQLCGGCKAVHHCTAGCQRAHWLEHRRGCSGRAGQGG
jgi:hypothetical protein